MTGHTNDARADENGFTGLVEEATDRLLRTAYLLCLDLDLAEDLMVHTWTTVAREWPTSHGIDATRLETRARHVLVSAAVRAQEDQEVPRPDDADHPPSSSLVGRRGEMALQRVEDRLEVQFALESLAPRQRAVLVLRYHEGFADAEIAQALDCPLSSVRCTTHGVVHQGEAAEELLSETFAWQASVVDADRVDAVVSRDYGRPRSGASGGGLGRRFCRERLRALVVRRRGPRR